MQNTKVTPERYAPHLSEFYPIMNNSGPRPSASQQRSPQSMHPDTQYTPSRSSQLSHSSLRSRSRRPSSSAASNTGSMMSDLQTLITRRDVQATQEAMASLTSAASEFSAALATVARCSSRMAGELEQFARLKGCGDDTAEKFMNASGLFHLLGNHELIMGDFAQDLLGQGVTDLGDLFQQQARALENDFNRKRKEESLKLKIQEKFNNDFSRRSVRNLVSYRESLHSLQQQLDQLELLKYDYYNDSYALVEGTCREVLGRVASVTRAQVEISENIARKGWSGGGLDDLLIDAEDPFAMNNGASDNENENEPENESAQVETDGEMTSKDNTDTANNGVALSTIPETSPLKQAAEPRMAGGTMTPPVGGLSAAVALSKLALVRSKTNSTNSDCDGDSGSDCDNDNSFALPMSSSAGDRASEVASAQGTPPPSIHS